MFSRLVCFVAQVEEWVATSYAVPQPPNQFDLLTLVPRNPALEDNLVAGLAFQYDPSGTGSLPEPKVATKIRFICGASISQNLKSITVSDV